MTKPKRVSGYGRENAPQEYTEITWKHMHYNEYLDYLMNRPNSWNIVQLPGGI